MVSRNTTTYGILSGKAHKEKLKYKYFLFFSYQRIKYSHKPDRSNYLILDKLLRLISVITIINPIAKIMPTSFLTKLSYLKKFRLIIMLRTFINHITVRST